MISVVVAGKNIAVGDKVARDSIAIKSISKNQLGDGAVRRIEEVSGRIAKAYIKKGSVIREKDVRD